jgi:hypothetical protein
LGAEGLESQGEGRGLDDSSVENDFPFGSQLLKRIETLSVIGTFLVSVSYLLHLARKAQRADGKKKLWRESGESHRRRPQHLVKVQSEQSIPTTASTTTSSNSFLVQVQVLGLSTAFLCNLVARRFTTSAREPTGHDLGRGGGKGGGISRKIETVAASSSSSTETDNIWKAVTRLSRHQSRHSVKQRITRRALEQQVETLTEKNLATSEALVEYSKEFRRLQNEVSQVYSVVAGLESAMRSQLDLISKLAERERESPTMERKGDESSTEVEKPSLQPKQEQLETKNCLQHAVCQCLAKSSSFTSTTPSAPAPTPRALASTLSPSASASACGKGNNRLQKVIGSTLARSSKSFLVQKQSKMPDVGVDVERGQGWSIFHFD